MPKTIGVVTSLGAAALHDVVTALQRRTPHIPVVIYPASVQGSQAAGELREALLKAYKRQEVDVLLLVRGGGAIDDLWAFNDEQLARTIVASPMPIISGVGHETDFTIADFCADVRAPTPTAAAELSAQPLTVWLDVLDMMLTRLQHGMDKQVQSCNQRLDQATLRLSRPSHLVTKQQARLAFHAQNLQHAKQLSLHRLTNSLQAIDAAFHKATGNVVLKHKWRLGNAELSLESLNPELVLKRGYAWLTDTDGLAITTTKQTKTGQAVRAILVDGEVDLKVSARRLF